MSSTMTRDTSVKVAEAAISAVAGGSLADLVTLVHPEATNREAMAEPPNTRGRGPQAFRATGEWLRAAFSDLVWTTEQSITEGDLVVTFGTMSGRHTGDFVVWTPDGTSSSTLLRYTGTGSAAAPRVTTGARLATVVSS